jgi:uncharacterized protein
MSKLPETLSDNSTASTPGTHEAAADISRNIGLFLLLTAAFSSIFFAFIIATGHVGGGNGVYELGLMWSPAMAALLTCRLSGISLKSLGWSWGSWRWQWLAFTVPLGYTVVAYALVWILGYGGFPDPKFIAGTRASLGWTGAPDGVVLAGYFLLIGSEDSVVRVFYTGDSGAPRGFTTAGSSSAKTLYIAHQRAACRTPA